MKTTQPRHRDHLRCRRWPRLDRSWLRRVFVQGIVNPVLVMVGYVSAKEPAQMGFIDRNNVIEKLAAATTYPPFRESIGEGRQLHRMVILSIRTSKLSILIIR